MSPVTAVAADLTRHLREIDDKIREAVVMGAPATVDSLLEQRAELQRFRDLANLAIGAKS